MTRPDHHSGDVVVALGIPWLLEREYRRHRMLDAEGLPETFDAWQAMALAQTESGARAANIRVVKVVIHPAELEVWARQLGRKVNDQARSDFAEMLWRADADRWRAGAAKTPRRRGRSTPA